MHRRSLSGHLHCFGNPISNLFSLIKTKMHIPLHHLLSIVQMGYASQHCNRLILDRISAKISLLTDTSAI